MIGEVEVFRVNLFFCRRVKVCLKFIVSIMIGMVLD